MTANGAFASDLEPLIARHRPRLWIYGHIHWSVDTTLGATRVLANPGGYPGSVQALEQGARRCGGPPSPSPILCQLNYAPLRRTTRDLHRSARAG